MIYFDNAATTKPCSEAVEAVMKGLELFGNPSSLHGMGVEAECLINRARSSIAGSLGAADEEIYFTSCATESSNTAIFGIARTIGKRKKRIVTTSVEHPSVQVCCDELEKQGFEIVRVTPGEDGKISAEDIIAAVNDNTCLVSCMLVNNETGRILPVEKAFRAIKRRFPQTVTHCDCVQGYLKIPVKVKKLYADIISLSGHKIHAPKGIGAMYIKKGVRVPAFMYGGGQEKGFRSGTECVPLICGFGAAAEKYADTIGERFEKAAALRNYLFEKCGENGIHVNSDTECSPYISSIAVDGYKSEVLLHFLEQRGIYVSSGSACSKGKKSSVIREFGIAEKYQDSTLRVSFSEENTAQEIDSLIEALKSARQKLCGTR
ncbi:cysteine desulfurase family protein [Ruminococcus sp. Marseille-P6503]|uniref:cysteine desulfurase family protein n=1 Tax=Ruminococcus sp. Marseille-P6503 TaxID=2364796 RepID=UPI000F54AB3D|nr:cysteine desulfurase family protein [Ruminococcus sp. Marseille-P6503]